MRFLLILCGMIAVCLPARAQTPLDRAAQDRLSFVDDDDPDMAAAFRKARATLPQFLVTIRNLRPTIKTYAVKVAISDKNGVEYFWITGPSEKDGVFSGRVDNTPRTVRTVAEGQIYRFKENDIVDWMYFENQKMSGNFTVCVILKKDPPEDAKAFRTKFGLECD